MDYQRTCKQRRRSRASFLSLSLSLSALFVRYLRRFQCCTRERDSIHVLRVPSIIRFYRSFRFFSAPFICISPLRCDITCDEIVKRSLRSTRSVRHVGRDMCYVQEFKERKAKPFILRAKEKGEICRL